MILETVPNFSEWKVKQRSLAILLAQGWTRVAAAEELGITDRTVRQWANQGCRQFTPEEFAQAVLELSEKIGISSRDFWLQIAYEVFQKMIDRKEFPSYSALFDFIIEMVKGSGPSATMKTEIAVEGATFSREVIDLASKEMRKRFIDARFGDNGSRTIEADRD